MATQSYIPGIGEVWSPSDNPTNLPSGSKIIQQGDSGSKSGGGGSNTSASNSRQQEMNNHVFSNIPDIARQERIWWEEYVRTGKTNTSAQVQANQEADRIRKQLNSSYVGSTVGVSDKSLFNNAIAFPNANMRPGVQQDVVGAVGDEVAKDVNYAVGRYDTNSLIGMGASAAFILLIFKMIMR